MSPKQKRARLEIKAIVLGYAMSRLDAEYLRLRNKQTWREVFGEAADALSLPSSSIKNLRDEFDPFHDNLRRGWHRRSLRANRQRVMDELRELGEDALAALVDRIICSDEAAIAEAVDSLATAPRIMHNVAERLLTGKRAEEYFLENSEPIAGIDSRDVIDFRQSACGFDFGSTRLPQIGIEVKGLKKPRGEILFTDREWREAQFRRENYWLVVVGNLEAKPEAKLIRDPYERLHPSCSYQVSVTALWRTRVAVNDE